MGSVVAGVEAKVGEVAGITEFKDSSFSQDLGESPEEPQLLGHGQQVSITST